MNPTANKIEYKVEQKYKVNRVYIHVTICSHGPRTYTQRQHGALSILSLSSRKCKYVHTYVYFNSTFVFLFVWDLKLHMYACRLVVGSREMDCNKMMAMFIFMLKVYPIKFSVGM